MYSSKNISDNVRYTASIPTIDQMDEQMNKWNIINSIWIISYIYPGKLGK